MQKARKKTADQLRKRSTVNAKSRGLCGGERKEQKPEETDGRHQASGRAGFGNREVLVILSGAKNLGQGQILTSLRSSG